MADETVTTMMMWRVIGPDTHPWGIWDDACHSEIGQERGSGRPDRKPRVSVGVEKSIETGQRRRAPANLIWHDNKTTEA